MTLPMTLDDYKAALAEAQTSLNATRGDLAARDTECTHYLAELLAMRRAARHTPAPSTSLARIVALEAALGLPSAGVRVNPASEGRWLASLGGSDLGVSILADTPDGALDALEKHLAERARSAVTRVTGTLDALRAALRLCDGATR